MAKLRKVRVVLAVTLALNVLVSALKLAAGYYYGSAGMVADGFHSFFDASSNVIGLIGLGIAAAPPDRNHPYGHKKFETLAASAVAVMLFITCLELLERAYGQLTGASSPAEITVYGFAVMAVSIAVNTFVTRYESKKGREYGSDFLLADSAHTRSDIMASMSVIAGMAAVQLGFPAGDPIAAVVISVLIGRVGLGIMKNSANVLCDAAVIEPNEVETLCMAVEGVRRCHHIRSRGREDEVLIDLRVHVDPALSTAESHEIAHRVEEKIKKFVPGVAEVVVHIEPD
jgi:cation diffusion facilitator family transporter